MSSTNADAEKLCKKCLEQVKIYLTCFQCDAIYHIYCLKKVPGVHVNLQGHLFCCRNITSKRGRTEKNQGAQHKPSGKLIGKRSLDNNDGDLENYLPKRKDSETNKFKCDTCSSEFAAKNLLVNHGRKCPTKQQEKESIQELNGDEDSENCLPEEEDLERSEFNCGASSLELANREQQENHHEECHEKQGELPQEPIKDKAGLVCSFCKEENFQKESYEQHINRCEKHYSGLNAVISKRTPKVRILAKHSNPEKKYKCNHCKFSCYIEANLANHMRTHTNESTSPNTHILSKHSNAEKINKCNDSQYSTHRKEKLPSHTRIHTKERPFKCESCNYAAARKSSLNIHILAKHSNAEKRFKCDECKYSTHQKETLASHMRTHTNDRPFKCESCDYAATRKSQLNVHVLAKHSNTEKMYKCNDCEYAAYEKKNLVEHVRVHIKERPFKCESCNYAAARKSHLNIHTLAKHSNAEKKFKCNNCQYSTHQKEMIVLHMRTHTNERPFKCESCNYAAARKSHLNIHILAKHSNAKKCNEKTF